MSTLPIVLWQLEPLWGLPNGSPFCMKLETWLRMAGLPYEARSLTGPPKSSTGKIPYLERPDGGLVCDSSAIIELLTREHDVDLDRDLTPLQRTHSLLLQRTFEEHLYFLMLHERWLDERIWPVVRAAYFSTLPLPVRLLLPPILRRSVRRDAHGQGLARLSDAQRLARGRRDFAALATVLGDQPFFFGEPSLIDATAYAFIANTLWLPDAVRGPIAHLVDEHDNLRAYAERMRARYYGDGAATAKPA